MNVENNYNSILSQKVRNGLYVSYGIFVLLLSALRLLEDPYLNAIPSIEKQVGVLNYIYLMSCTCLYPPVVNLIIGYGLITRKEWVRYGVIAAMLTLPVMLSLLHVVFGTFITTGEILFQIFIALLLVTFCIKVPMHQDPKPIFRIRSVSGLLVLVILVLSVRPVFPALYMKIKSGEPIFIAEAKTLVIEPGEYKEEYLAWREIWLPDASLRIPPGYHIHSESSDGSSWEITLWNNHEGEKGLLIIGKEDAWADSYKSSEFQSAGITNRLAFDRFVHLNNWNPGAVFFRTIVAGNGKAEFSEFNIGALRGSLRAIDQTERIYYEFSLYGKDGSLVLGGSITSDDDGQRLAESIISSVKLSPPELNAADHYDRGLNLYEKGEFMDSRLAFSQAYLQEPENPEYAYMLAQSLLADSDKLTPYNSIERVLERALQANPEHEKTRQLLEDVRASHSE